MTRYFAYGANLDTTAMAERCPRAALLGPAVLPDHRFRIGAAGYGTVVPRTGQAVFGVLWDLTPEDEAALDRFEGLADGLYRKVSLVVEPPSGPPVEAMAYQAADGRVARPVAGYVESVVAAGARCGLPAEYLRALARWAEAPLPNHYRVSPEASLWAGEYPGHFLPREGAVRLQTLVDHGTSYFVDLTEPDELLPYQDGLAGLVAEGEAVPEYRRLSIPDMGTPAGADRMRDILDTIDGALADGHRVYVHCWGGIGRTGTVVGCWLTRRGFSGDAALAQVGRLFAATPKGQGGRRSPETEAQAAYVRRWAEGSLPSSHD